MTRPLFTGSSVERAAACPASEALPHVRADSAPARRGTAIHAFLAAVPAVGRDAALELVPAEHRAACEAINLARIPQVDPASFAPEVAFALDLSNGAAREIGRDIGRAYGDLGVCEVPLTVDVLGLSGESVFVGDYKTGRGHVTPAAENWQLRTGAVAAARAYGRSSAEVALIRVFDSGFVQFDTATLDVFDLDAHEDALRDVAQLVEEARGVVAAGALPDVHPGDHCRYCKAFPACPAKVSLLRTIVEAPSHLRGTISAALQESEDPMASALDAERARQAYYLWRRAKEVVDRAGDQLHAYAAEVGGIPLDNGEVFGPVRTAREYVDGTVTHKVLTALHGREAADRAVTLEATKAGISKSLRVVAAESGGKITKLVEQALAQIEAEGGIDRRASVTVKEHAPKRAKEIAS